MRQKNKENGGSIEKDAALHLINSALGTFLPRGGFGGVAEEAPGAYEHVSAVMDSAQAVEFAKKVAYLVPLICIKGRARQTMTWGRR